MIPELRYKNRLCANMASSRWKKKTCKISQNETHPLKPFALVCFGRIKIHKGTFLEKCKSFRSTKYGSPNLGPVEAENPHW